MRLSTRLSLFFLGALGLVLVGFSVALYVLASRYLLLQAEERLEAALNTLAAAAEVGPDGVEWDTEERHLSFGLRTVEGQLCWLVCDGRGRRLDGSSANDIGRFLHESMLSSRPTARPKNIVDRDGRTWRVRSRRLVASTPLGGEGSGPVEPVASNGKHEALVLGAGVSLDRVQAALRNLSLVLVALSLGIWALALGFGRRLCRRALQPVTGMAEAARAMSGDDLDQRLPVPESDDELEELARTFNAALDRLQESFERQRRFTGDASHQLRTPLTIMLGQVDLALKHERSTEEYRRALRALQRQAQNLRRIVDSLLFLARANAEALQPELEPIELEAWLTDYLRCRQDDPRAADIGLERDSDGPFVIRAQSALLVELVNNLLDNASKYSEPGTPIVIRLNRAGRSVLLSVDDRGIGIAEKEIAHVFDPFYRSPQARKRGVDGLGLGLSVAQRLAHLFGGSIEVWSELRQGSSFTVRFPADSCSRAPTEPTTISPITQAGVKAD